VGELISAVGAQESQDKDKRNYDTAEHEDAGEMKALCYGSSKDEDGALSWQDSERVPGVVNMTSALNNKQNVKK
jgi:hypothetical protein